MTEPYPVETLDENEDDGTMPATVATLADAVVGRRIVSFEKTGGHGHFEEAGGVITLDDGSRVQMRGSGDCCAYTEVDNFLLHAHNVDHIITGVGTTDGYTRWHIFADMCDVLEINVAWSAGNVGYYGYGFYIDVEPPPALKELT